MENLTGRIRSWFERTPKAQSAYRRLSTDLDAVVDRLDSATSGLRERVAPIIDPVVLPKPGEPTESAEAASPAETTAETTPPAAPATPSAEAPADPQDRTRQPAE